MEGEDDVARLVALGIDGAERRERDEGIIAHRALVRLVYAHHLINNASCADVLSHKIERSTLQQFLRHVGGDDDVLTLVAQVEVVDEASHHHRALVYHHIVGIDAADVHARGGGAAIYKRLRRLVEFGTHILDIFAEAVIGHCHVLVVEFHSPAFSHTGVSL